MIRSVWMGSQRQTLESGNPDISTCLTIRPKYSKTSKVTTNSQITDSSWPYIICLYYIFHIQKKIRFYSYLWIWNQSLNLKPVTKSLLKQCSQKLTPPSTEKKIHQANTNQKNARLSILISDKTDYKAKKHC